MHSFVEILNKIRNGCVGHLLRHSSCHIDSGRKNNWGRPITEFLNDIKERCPYIQIKDLVPVRCPLEDKHANHQPLAWGVDERERERETLLMFTIVVFHVQITYRHSGIWTTKYTFRLLYSINVAKDILNQYNQAAKLLSLVSHK